MTPEEYEQYYSTIPEKFKKTWRKKLPHISEIVSVDCLDGYAHDWSYGRQFLVNGIDVDGERTIFIHIEIETHYIRTIKVHHIFVIYDDDVEAICDFHTNKHMINHFGR